MQQRELHEARPDGDPVLDRGPFLASSSNLARKRPRSSTGSPSGRASRKLSQPRTQTNQPQERHPLEQSLQRDEADVTHSTKLQSTSSHERLCTKVASEDQLHQRQGSSLLQAAADASPDTTRPPTSNSQSSAFDENLQKLHDLSQQAHELGSRQQTQFSTVERLQTRLLENERMYGELLRKSMELQRTIERYREQVRIDKMELDTERAALRTTGDELFGAVALLQQSLAAIHPADLK